MLILLLSGGQKLVPIFSRSLEHTSQVLTPLNAQLQSALQGYHEIFNFNSPADTHRGFIRVGDNIVLVSSTSISNTASTASPNGTFILGKYISRSMVRDWGKALSVEIDLQIPRTPGIPTEQTESVSDLFRTTFLTLKDPRDIAVAFIELRFPRTVYLKGIAARNQIITVVFVIGVIFLGLIYLLLDTVIGRRFTNLQKQLADIGEHPQEAKPISTYGNDELGSLVKIFNKVLFSLAENRKEAQLANAAKSRFLANMSHEIRTPINGVLGMLELLTTADLAPSQMEYAHIARDSVLELSRIVNDILDLSKIEAEKMTMELTTLSLKKLVREVCKVTEIAAHEKGLIILEVSESDVPEYVKGDSGKIRQILHNLLTNSVKFTSRGGIVLRTHIVQRIDQHKATVAFSISDSGRGFSEADRERVFMPFEQSDGSETRTTHGTGLGLTISRQLATLMGGSLEAQSLIGIGSRFTLTLPLEVVNSPEQESKDEPWWKMSTRSYNVLVAEDNLVNQKLVRSILEKAGHSVTIVPDGQSAVNSCQHSCFDVVLMDIQMPILSGLDATKIIKADPKTSKIPIIALTASVLEQDREQYLRVGMSGLVAKPLRPIDLITALNSSLESPKKN